MKVTMVIYQENIDRIFLIGIDSKKRTVVMEKEDEKIVGTVARKYGFHQAVHEYLQFNLSLPHMYLIGEL